MIFIRKKLLRCVTACVVILLLLFMMQGPVLCISLYIWNLIAGIVLKYILELKMISFYIVAIPTFWMLFLVESYFYSKLLLNMTTTEYLLKMAEKMQELEDLKKSVDHIPPEILQAYQSGSNHVHHSRKEKSL